MAIMGQGFVGVPSKGQLQMGFKDPRQPSSYLSSMLQSIPEAQQITRAISEAQPQGFGGFIAPLLEKGITSGITGSGTGAQYALGRQRAGEALNTALSRMHRGITGAGGQVGPGATREAEAAYGNMLAELEAKEAESRRLGTERATSTLAGLANIPAEQSRAAQTGFGNFLSTLTRARNTPFSGVRFWR